MIDGFGRSITYMRLSVTELCNLRCRYCMPAAGVPKKEHADMLTEEEMICAVRAAARLGINKLRITGGEPLVKPNILSICEKAAAVPGIREVCMTTNGVLLKDLAKPLREAGIRRINISLDTLDPVKYEEITRVGKIEKVREGIEAALDAGFDQVKINAVLIGGFNDMEIPAIAGLTREYPLDVRFIELMPMMERGEFSPDAYISGDLVLEKLPELMDVSEEGGVAKLYRFPDGLGKIGLINPISAHFCGRCNRIRLTADGRIKPCLHRPAELSLKGLDEEGMMRQFEAAIRSKPEWHGELNAASPSQAGRSMNSIGG